MLGYLVGLMLSNTFLEDRLFWLCSLFDREPLAVLYLSLVRISIAVFTFCALSFLGNVVYRELNMQICQAFVSRCQAVVRQS